MLKPGKLYKLISRHGFFIQRKTNLFDFTKTFSLKKDDMILFVKQQENIDDLSYVYNVFFYKNMILYNQTRKRDIYYFSKYLEIINYNSIGLKKY